MASSVTIFPVDPAAEARRLADLFSDLSDAVDDLLLTAPAKTPPERLASLRAQAQALEDKSHFFTAKAIGATLQSIQQDLDHIKKVTTQAKAQLGVLNEVSKAIAIATSAVNLGTAIAEGNPAAILTATDALATTIAG